MPELKVQCDCGQRYKFDVEPVNGRMPFKVTCPVCGMDGTEKANGLLHELAFSPPPPPAAPPAPPKATTPIVLRPIAAAAPAAAVAPVPRMMAAPPVPPPVTAPPSATPMPPPSVPPEKPRLRITKPGYEAAPESAAAVAEAAPPPAPPVSRPRMAAARPAPAPGTSERPPNLVLGILGAVVGGFVGMLGWFLLIKATGWIIGYAAVGVGFLAGVGARMLGRGGSPVLGAVAATCAMVAILGGQYWFAADFIKSKLGPLAGLVEGLKDVAKDAASEEYDQKAKHGEEALRVQTDEEISALYQKLNSAKPDAEELAEFKQTELPQLREIGSGKLTKQQYVKNQIGEAENLGFKLRWEMFKQTMDGFTILFLLLGITTAFKIGNG